MASMIATTMSLDTWFSASTETSASGTSDYAMPLKFLLPFLYKRLSGLLSAPYIIFSSSEASWSLMS